MKVGLHQRSVLRPLLFSAVMDVVSSEARSGLPSELLYADDLVSMAPTMEQLGKRVADWRASLLGKGLKVNAGKSKVMVGSSGGNMIVNSGKWPCGVCGKGVQAPNDTAYKRWSCHSGFKLLCKLCRTSPPPAMGARFTVFWACRPCGPAGWLALLLTKAGDVETNPGPTTLNKKVWICDICYKQIHVRKQISIRCNRIEHWVHLRCAGIRQAQYTDTWTCHLHR